MKKIIKILLIFLFIFCFVINTYIVSAETSIQDNLSIDSQAALLIEN